MRCKSFKILLLLIAALVTGCSWKAPFSWGTEPAAEAPVGNQWDTPYARLGLVPVSPPSEDVRVGDIFVYPFNPDQRIAQKDEPGLALNPRWNTLPLLGALDAEYKLRPAWSEADISDGQSLFAPDRTPTRLRNFGLPEFSTFKLLSGDVNSLIPTEAINLVFGAAWNDDKVVSIRVNSAETYSLGLQQIIDAALSQTGPGSVLKPPYREHLSVIGDPAISSVWLRILSDVVYVRSLDIIIQANDGFNEDEEAMAAEFVAEIESTETVTEEVEAAPGSDGEPDLVMSSESVEGSDDEAEQPEVTRSETVSVELTEHTLDPAYTAFVRANAINQMLIESGTDDSPGGFLRFVNITDDSVTIRRTWQRGLAIGVRGLSLEIDKDTGTVLRSATMGTLSP